MAAQSKKGISFSSLVEALTKGGAEARTRLVEFVRQRPKLALPHIEDIASLLDSSKAPIRNASVEMLAILSRVSPTAMAFLIPTLHNLLSSDPHNSIANHAIEILLNYARTSKDAAQKVVPILHSQIKRLAPPHAAKVKDAIRELS